MEKLNGYDRMTEENKIADFEKRVVGNLNNTWIIIEYLRQGWQVYARIMVTISAKVRFRDYAQGRGESQYTICTQSAVLLKLNVIS